MGKVIRIYLADGTASGIRHAELGNWTGQALAIPRSLTGQAKEWPELQKPGVYFLFGPETDDGKSQAYVGEAENVLVRLAQHLDAKEWWEQAVCFSSKDEHLTKAHVRYLESVFIQAAFSAGRYTLENTTRTTQPALPRGDRDMMDEFAGLVRVLLSALGFPLLEPILQSTTKRLPEREGSLEAPVGQPTGEASEDKQPLFTYAIQQASARGVRTTEGFVVFKGSTAMARNADNGSYHSLKERLVTQGVLVPQKGSDGLLVFDSDHLFASPSGAASVVAGHNQNGLEAWRAENGQTLKQWEAKQLV